MFSEEETKCSNCGYAEPAGSAHFVTFLTEVLCEFISNLGIDEITIGDVVTNKSAWKYVISGNGALPAILINTNKNTESIKGVFGDLSLKTVQDDNTLYGLRVVTTKTAIRNPAPIVASLAETIYTAYLDSQKKPELKKANTLDLGLIQPIGSAKEQIYEHSNAAEEPAITNYEYLGQ